MSKVDAADPSDKDLRYFTSLQGKKERVWQRLQQAYDLIKQLPHMSADFLARAERIESDCSLFNDILSELEKLSCLHERFQVNTLQLSAAFDNLFFSVIAERDALLKARAPTSSTSAPRRPSSSYLPQLAQA